MIATLTLNPAVDRLIYLDVLRKNVTNRIGRVEEVLGGKGTHVSANLRLLGARSRAFGVCHGGTGRRIMGMLEEAGVEVEFIHRDGAESRTNYLLVEGGSDCTIVAERGVPLGGPTSTSSWNGSSGGRPRATASCSPATRATAPTPSSTTG